MAATAEERHESAATTAGVLPCVLQLGCGLVATRACMQSRIVFSILTCMCISWHLTEVSFAMCRLQLGRLLDGCFCQGLLISTLDHSNKLHFPTLYCTGTIVQTLSAWSSMVATIRAYCDEFWLCALDLPFRSVLLWSAIASTVSCQLTGSPALTGYSDINWFAVLGNGYKCQFLMPFALCQLWFYKYDTAIHQIDPQQ